MKALAALTILGLTTVASAGQPLDLRWSPGAEAALAAFNGFYSAHSNYVVENPIHNLAALAAGVLLLVVLAVWIVRRLWKRRRTSRTSSS